MCDVLVYFVIKDTPPFFYLYQSWMKSEQAFNASLVNLF